MPRLENINEIDFAPGGIRTAKKLTTKRVSVDRLVATNEQPITSEHATHAAVTAHNQMLCITDYQTAAIWRVVGLLPDDNWSATDNI